MGEDWVIFTANEIVGTGAIEETAVGPVRAGWDYPDVPRSAGILPSKSLVIAY